MSLKRAASHKRSIKALDRETQTIKDALVDSLNIDDADAAGVANDMVNELQDCIGNPSIDRPSKCVASAARNVSMEMDHRVRQHVLSARGIDREEAIRRVEHTITRAVMGSVSGDSWLKMRKEGLEIAIDKANFDLGKVVSKKKTTVTERDTWKLGKD